MARRLPSLTAVRAFEAAARLGSFTAAARELSVTHAAISRQIRALETWFDIKLFERRHRKVVLTAVGKSYLPAITNAFDLMAAASGNLANRGRPGRLVVGVDPGLVSLWLGRRINSFLQDEPELDIEIIPTLDPSAPSDQSLHAGIFFNMAGSKRNVENAGWRREVLLELHAFPVCHPTFVERPGGLKTLSDMSALRLLHEQSTNWWRIWLEASGATNVDWSKGPIFYDTGLALAAAVNGEGIAIGDSVLAADELESGRLSKPFELSVECGAYSFYWNDFSLTHQKFKSFRSWLRRLCKDQMTRSAKWL